MKKTIEQFYILFPFLMVLVAADYISAQSEPVGPGKVSFDGNIISGKFLNWDRKATPMLVLRIHGAGKLQTFADISSNGAFKLQLPKIPADGNYGSMNCGSPDKDPIVVATDISLLTKLPGFSSPGRWDRGYSVIGMALLADKKFSENIGKPGGKRAHWLYSKVSRTVEAGECNNTNSFTVGTGWNVFFVISGPGGGPHTYKSGLDEDLGWYWYAFPEDITKGNSTKEDSDDKKNSDEPATNGIKADWLVGEWNGVQQDTRIYLELKPSGEVQLESIESGRKKTGEGKWSLNNGEFVLDIKEGTLQFNIERTSETTFRLFGKDAVSDIVFERKGK